MFELALAAIKIRTLDFAKSLRCPDTEDIIEYDPTTQTLGKIVVKAGE